MTIAEKSIHEKVNMLQSMEPARKLKNEVTQLPTYNFRSKEVAHHELRSSLICLIKEHRPIGSLCIGLFSLIGLWSQVGGLLLP